MLGEKPVPVPLSPQKVSHKLPEIETKLCSEGLVTDRMSHTMSLKTDINLNYKLCTNMTGTN